MTLALIAAIGKNRIIGVNGKLPWHLSEDLKRFKRLTVGHAVLMGRKTFESIGKPLVNRRNIVISSKQISNVETYSSVDEALKVLANLEKVFVIGGGQIYAQLLERADELYLTIVERDFVGDTFFPPFEHLLNSLFTLVNEEQRDGYRFVDYKRVVK